MYRFVSVIVLLNTFLGYNLVSCKNADICPTDIHIRREDVIRLHVFRTDNADPVDTPQTLEVKNCGSNWLNLNELCKNRNKYKLIVHGFAETWNMSNRWDWVRVMRNELLHSQEASELCVVVVDWKELAAGGSVIANYWTAIDNMKIAGELLANILYSTAQNPNVDVHCIGFSLGGHMCSMFGKMTFIKYRRLIERISGLDPAGPFFNDKPINEKLHYTDAKLVDVIHTSDSLGMSKNGEGHMNFYADDGASNVNACDDINDRMNARETVILFEESKTSSNQNQKYDDIHLSDKDIENGNDGFFNKLTVKYVKNKFLDLVKSLWNKLRGVPKRVFVSVHQFFGCSHLMAVRFFIYSINDCIYRSVHWNCTQPSPCPTMYTLKGDLIGLDSVPRLGYYADRAASQFKQSYANFYINTTSKAPFCVHGSTRTAKLYKLLKRFLSKKRHYNHYYYQTSN